MFGSVHCHAFSWVVGPVPGCLFALGHARIQSTDAATAGLYLASMPGVDDYLAICTIVDESWLSNLRLW